MKPFISVERHVLLKSEKKTEKTRGTYTHHVALVVALKLRKQLKSLMACILLALLSLSCYEKYP